MGSAISITPVTSPNAELSTPSGTRRYIFFYGQFAATPLLSIDSTCRCATRRKQPFHIDAWVVLPDHLHCIWTLSPGDDDFSNRGKAIKIRFVQSIPVTERRSNTHIARSTNRWIAFQASTLHPVKHRWVKRVHDWPFSTFHRFVSEGIYPNDWGGIDNDIQVGQRR